MSKYRIVKSTNGAGKSTYEVERKLTEHTAWEPALDGLYALSFGSKARAICWIQERFDQEEVSREVVWP